MRKYIFQAIYTVLMGLSIYSCSEVVLPKRVGVKGTVNLPIRIGAANLNAIITEKVTAAFSSGTQEGSKVYNVDYKGQTIQTFCIYLPMIMTEDLNPNNFLKTIDRQINNGIDAEPKKIHTPIPYEGYPVPISQIKLFEDNKIPSVSLEDIAQYVITIDFGKCNGNDISAGIGLNFHFTEMVPGLQMTIVCNELDILTTKELEPGDNIFGNDKAVQLKLDEGYKDDSKRLNFRMILQSTGPDPDVLNLTQSGLIEGEMRLFRVWTEAKINLAAAITSKTDDLTGRYPATPFDFSELGEYFHGEFLFKDLTAKLYIDGPDSDSVNGLDSKLLMEAQYQNGKKVLYNDALFIGSQPINPDNYLDKNGHYKNKNLPENSKYNDKMDNDAIADVFKAMPDDLFFTYRILVDENKVLTIYPHSFDDSDDSGGSGIITTTLMMMMPMSLIATGDNDNKSAIVFPDMFGSGDLFGREEPEDLFDKGDIDYVKMTISSSYRIFTKGNLFINETKDLFPDGVRLNGKNMTMNFTDKRFDIIRENLIFPNIRIEFDKGGTINVPKKTGIVNIKFEMKSFINTGEL